MMGVSGLSRYTLNIYWETETVNEEKFDKKGLTVDFDKHKNSSIVIRAKIENYERALQEEWRTEAEKEIFRSGLEDYRIQLSEAISREAVKSAEQERKDEIRQLSLARKAVEKVPAIEGRFRLVKKEVLTESDFESVGAKVETLGGEVSLLTLKSVLKDYESELLVRAESIKQLGMTVGLIGNRNSFVDLGSLREVKEDLAGEIHGLIGGWIEG